MEIHWHCYVIINCAVLIPYLAGKTFSLNKAIAEESYQGKELERQVETSSSSKIESTAERFSLNKALRSVIPVKSEKIQKSAVDRNIFSLNKITSPLKYRKTFKITSPLKPKKLKFVLKPWNKRKNKSIKRDVNGNEKFNRKYIPLLKSIGMLVDNLLDSDASESHEVPKNIQKRNRDYSGEKRVCTCALRSNTKSNEETITSTTTFSPEVSTTTETVPLSETTAAPTNHTTLSYIGGLRQNKNIPILFPRNTFSGWRDYNGHSEGGHTAHNRNTQRDITWNHGDGEHITSGGQSDQESNEENTYGYTRNDASSDGLHPRLRGDRNSPEHTIYGNPVGKADEASEDKETINSIRRRFNELKGENKFEVGGNETESTNPVPKFIQRLRRLPQDKVHHISEPVQPKEANEKSIFSDSDHITSHKRFTERDGTITTDDKNVRARNEAVTSKLAITTNKNKTKKPVVFIIDGYSVTRDKNGENKISEKTIRLRS